MLVVDKITDLTPVKNLNVKGLIPKNINLADVSFYVPGPIDCLLGAEIFYELLRSAQIRYKNSNLIFQNTVFGFVASGSNSFADTEARVHCGLIKGDLNQTLKMFWELENVEVEKPKNEEAIFCEDHFLKTHSRDEEGRYVVKMPLKNEPNCLGESRDIALKRLNALWTRLIRDPQYLKLYRDFIHEYDQLGHMKEVVAEHDNSEVAYYMPHHGVLRPEKSTTKLRVVFNATNPTSNGLSLNSIQYNGGLVQNDLFTIMIKFREHPYAFAADVKMMYRMILIHESQQPLLRILWKESPEDPVKTFEMKTVTYGMVSAPFLATRTLLQLSRYEENFPLAAPVLRENFYMDDVLCGAASLMEAKALKNQLSGILKKGGMELHKWGSSHPELASNILGDYEFENPIETKTLGVSWKSQEDCFVFKIAVELKVSYTKRCVLSTIARLFDPLGLLGPVVARAKIFMQSLWSLKIDWIDELPSERAKEWHRFPRGLQQCPQALLYQVRQRFWPLRGRNVCRKIVHDCLVCFKVKPITCEQIMGNLPKERVRENFPFDCSGIDFIGPFWIKSNKQRKSNLYKIYVSIFVCFVTKAVHFELVSDLTTQTFIASFKRFIARRGRPSLIFSDNGKTFIGANAELKRLYKLVINPDPELAGFLVDENINRKFLPPRAPNFGGLWEAGVKSFKFHFKREAGNSRFTYEEFLTIMTQIEGILNSRPLTLCQRI
ncbi:integrase catalytic domain-containing protein [Trichonephila clavipes]|uniref:Integrase catalytic domain-containing protein n=1 Tax=Trichonephila clavipes TaxID=2585209 RepID=A0A8X6RY45_TRICX|nr:integrase catalytic domain-containing protein [Trichonephila clavipes]